MATMRKAVKPTWVMGLEVAGLELELPGRYYRKANPELHARFHGWIKRFSALLESGKLKPHPIQVNRGGLAKVIEGMGAFQRKARPRSWYALCTIRQKATVIIDNSNFIYLVMEKCHRLLHTGSYRLYVRLATPL